MFHTPIPPKRYYGYVSLIDLGPISFLCMRPTGDGYLLLLIVVRGRPWRWSISLYGVRTPIREPPRHPAMHTLGPVLMLPRIWFGVISSTTPRPFPTSDTWKELSVTLPNQAQIRLYGGALAYERMRGIYLDGAVLDEYPLLHPNAFTSVVRPCLADYRGFAIVSGTAAGEDHFHALKLRADDDPNWAVFDIPVTATAATALSPQEVEEMRQDMSPDEFAREMLCSFAAPVEGAYYQEALNALQLQNRVTRVSPDLNTSVITAWDLGIRHLQCIWLFQIAGREVHWIDYIEGTGKSLSHYADLLALKAKVGGFAYRAHLLPHDVEVRELTTGKNRSP